MKQATVIIPNYNGFHFLKPCIDALRTQDTQDFDICVVDNGSSDESRTYLETQEDIRTIYLPKNEGFCGAVNKGAEETQTPYMILLNNDTVPESGFVSALIRGIKNHKNAFSCSACMLDINNSDILDGAGDLYSAFGWAFAKGKGEPAANYSRSCRVFSSCAGAAIYDTKLFKEFGMLDERHFAYLEDMDLSFRARTKGYEMYYIPEARVVHVGSGTAGGKHTDMKVRLSARNNLYMIYKNMPAWMFVLNFLTLAAGTLLKYAYFKKEGFGEAYIEGLKEGVKLCRSPQTKERRVVYDRADLKNYLNIQLQLWANMFVRRKI